METNRHWYRVKVIEQRERFMDVCQTRSDAAWLHVKNHLADENNDPSKALFPDRSPVSYIVTGDVQEIDVKDVVIPDLSGAALEANELSL